MNAAFPLNTRTVLIGTAATVIFFSMSAALVASGYTVWTAVESASSVGTGWDADGVSELVGWYLLIGSSTFVVALGGSTLVAILFGVPASIAANIALRRSTSPAVHASGAFVIGLLSGAPAYALFLATGAEMFAWVTLALAPFAAFSSAAGWITAWRSSILIARRSSVVGRSIPA